MGTYAQRKYDTERMPNDALHFTFHDVPGDGNCFYAAVVRGLEFAGHDDLLHCDPAMPHKARVRCFRERVGSLIRVSSKYDVALQTLRQLALDGFVQNSTVMATLMNHYPAEWATMPLRRFKKLYGDVVAATNVYASELEFTVVDHWLQKHSIKLYNLTRSSMKRRSYLLGALRAINTDVADRVLLLSTDDLHYNWVTASYRAYGEQVVHESLMHIDTLMVLLTVSVGARGTATMGGGQAREKSEKSEKSEKKSTKKKAGVLGTQVAQVNKPVSFKGPRTRTEAATQLERLPHKRLLSAARHLKAVRKTGDATKRHLATALVETLAPAPRKA